MRIARATRTFLSLSLSLLFVFSFVPFPIVIVPSDNTYFYAAFLSPAPFLGAFSHTFTAPCRLYYSLEIAGRTRNAAICTTVRSPLDNRYRVTSRRPTSSPVHLFHLWKRAYENLDRFPFLRTISFSSPPFFFLQESCRNRYVVCSFSL